MSALIHWLSSSQQTLQSMGWMGVFAFAGIAALVQMTLAPLSPLGIAAGLSFGFGRGFAAMELGTGAGIVINFFIARYLARGAISRLLSRHEKFRIIDEAIGREGGKIVLLLRLCPIPFGLSNFCYGLTAVRFWPYFFASVVGIIPGNAFFTWVGSTAKEGLQEALTHHRRSPLEYALLFVGIAAAFIALTYVSRGARAAVANQAKPASAQDS